MDAYCSGEELLVKTRKPYTITKQRERWTEEDHNRFLEALKLYGRAWQRIEEHIGTKTAVQIRSHAQKFFSKLEKEALVKGVSVGQAIDIEIPPPRPKRKPTNPYPRKIGAASSSNTQVRANNRNQVQFNLSHSTKQVVDVENEPLPEEALSSLGTSRGENSVTTETTRKLSNCKEYLPVKRHLINNVGRESCAEDEPNGNHRPDNPDSVGIVEIDMAKSFQRHAPVQTLDGSLGACSQGLCSEVSYQESTLHQTGFPGHSSLLGIPAVSAVVESQNSSSRSNNHLTYPSLHPLNHFPNTQVNYSSFLQMSSSFSSLLVSALLQNPAAHAAASFAASVWPTSTTVDNSTKSQAGNNLGFTLCPMNPPPRMAALAEATVAAATAWWAAHGMLPLCAPFHSGVSVPPGSVTTPANVGQGSPAIEGSKGNNSQIPGSYVQQPDRKISEDLQPPQSACNSSVTSSSDSGITGENMDIGVAATSTEKVPVVTEKSDACKGKNKKQVDRSSCGSNTPSGSDAETDALGKNDKVDQEAKEPDVNNTTSELRRNRVPSIVNDNWKEVSEEGRLAFQALFARERLPQSFSPPQVTSRELAMNDGVENQRSNAELNCKAALQLDLNSCTWESVSCDQGTETSRSRGEHNHNDVQGLLTMGLSQGKLSSNRTGFKPYKRCAVVANESRMLNSSCPEQEKCSKRLRLEEEASI